MRLEGGPKELDGEEIPAPPDRWVWVARCEGETHVFDLSRPEDAQRTLNRVDREQWAEYQRDPGDPSVYRFCRSLPARPR